MRWNKSLNKFPVIYLGVELCWRVGEFEKRKLNIESKHTAIIRKTIGLWSMLLIPLEQWKWSIVKHYKITRELNIWYI